jgi:Mg-chelatase subunit ChlD
MGTTKKMFGFGKKKVETRVVGSLTDAQLGELDIILLVDNSGSMGHMSRRVAGNRLEEVQHDVLRTAQVAEQFDADGITVIEFGSTAQVFDNVGSLKVAGTFKQFNPAGSTNLTAALELAVEKAASTTKNAIVICWTDGRPDSEKTAKDVIERAGQLLGRPKIGFTFIQVGDDPGAGEFLDTLDNSMKVDVCATVRASEATSLTIHQLAWLAQNA